MVSLCNKSKNPPHKRIYQLKQALALLLVTGDNWSWRTGTRRANISLCLVIHLLQISLERQQTYKCHSPLCSPRIWIFSRELSIKITNSFFACVILPKSHPFTSSLGNAQSILFRWNSFVCQSFHSPWLMLLSVH